MDKEEIDRLKESINNYFLRDQEEQRKKELKEIIQRSVHYGGLLVKYRPFNYTLNELLRSRLPLQKKTLMSYPETSELSIGRRIEMMRDQLFIAREALYTRWLEDRAEERRRETAWVNSICDTMMLEFLEIDDFFNQKLLYNREGCP